MIEIIPALLATTEEEYKEGIEKIHHAPSFEGGWVHIDLMDNFFVQNESVSLEVVKKYPIELKKEAHLMVLKPLDWLDGLLELGFERIIIHAEAEEVERCIEYIKGRGREVGLALKVGTSLESLQNLLPKIDLLLIMTIEIGFQGQPLKAGAMEKISQAVRLREQNMSALLTKENLHYKVGADGHINDEDVRQIVDSGAENLVVGSYFMKSDDIEESLEKIWEKIKQ